MKRLHFFSSAFFGFGISLLFICAAPIRLEDTPPGKYEAILQMVGGMLEQGHYSPKKIDDNFSKEIFKEFLKRLDGNKRILLEKDVKELRKYETSIDDAVHGQSLEFFYKADEIYKTRLEESQNIYKELITKPFDFSKDEDYELDPDKLGFGSESDRKERWRKYLKYLVLDKFIELQDAQEKAIKDKKEGFKPKTDVELEEEARAKVKKSVDKYLDRLSKFDENQRFAALVNSITNTMDPHTDFFPPVDKRAFDERMSGRYFGIGALLTQEGDYVKIKNVTPGGPAFKSGEIKDGDLIVKVGQGAAEPEEIVGYTTDEAVKLIRGGEGTEVRITVKKPDGTLKTVSMIRAELKLDETFARSVIIEGKQKIGLIDLPAFYADFSKHQSFCSRDVAREVERLKAEGVEGIILDLRDNGGGSLQEVVNMVGLFIKTGPVVQIRDRSGRASVLADNDPRVIYDGPLMVMVNERSASASEIFASAIQDYKRGIVIGSSSTFGKGTVQRAFPLGQNGTGSGAGDMGSVHLTLQKYYRINGGSTQLKGVESDVVLPGVYEQYKVREKDAPNALIWDEMPKANYSTWEATADVAELQQKFNERSASNDVFKQIKEKTSILADSRKTTRSLKIDKYKNQSKEIRDISAKVRELQQMKTELPIANLKEDLTVINSDSVKKERNDFWVKYLKKDVYLNETLNIMGDMVQQKGMAVKKN